MSRKTLFAAFLATLLPLAAYSAKTYNEAEVVMLDGTIMLEREGAEPSALQTGSTVRKGDVLTVYDEGWVILKTKRGDRIGLDEGTVLAVDEYHFEGPDRQVRLILRQGALLLRVKNASSRQSFFEVNVGSQVAAVGDAETILTFDPQAAELRTQYFRGKLSVIDRENEHKFEIQHTETRWSKGKRESADPVLVEELDFVNFKRFFDGKPRLKPSPENIVLPERDAREKPFGFGAPKSP